MRHNTGLIQILLINILIKIIKMEYVFVTIFEKKSVSKPLIGTHKYHALIKSLTFLVSLFFDTWEFKNILQTIIIIAKVL